MVDVNLEAVDGDSFPQDLFLSLRVGDQQKFAKAGSTRSYKFAPTQSGAEKKMGKLEIYRRVGVANMSLDQERMQGVHEMSVKVDDQRLSSELKYRVSLNGEVPSSPTGPASPQAAAKRSEKVSAAREYLNQHQLEQRLADAMQAVLRERPEDPGAFIAARLASGTGMTKKVADAPLPPQVPSAAANPQSATAAHEAEDVGIALSLDIADDYPLNSAADPIMPSSLMIGPGMCTYANVGRPAVMFC
eukprot:TRINITY_DN44320_c0_g1_i1.p1 TRINITY_DN44320_c0_g1~~TRINITY_DN44320_c0_g1_i1.p1  ORF type:complete len:246 (-),score=56.45 TRINITY_DN44320_c0_g1_i1:111-848(-)